MQAHPALLPRTQMDTALSTAGADFEQLQKRGLIIRQEDNGK